MEQVAPTEASDGMAIEFGFRHMLHDLGPVAAVHHLASLPMTTHRPSTRVNAFGRVETGGRSQKWSGAINVDAMRDGWIDTISCLVGLLYAIAGQNLEPSLDKSSRTTFSLQKR